MIHFGSVAPLIDDAWAGQPAVLIGGGSSAASIEWEYVGALKRIAVSRAGHDLPDAFGLDAWVSIDRTFWDARSVRGDVPLVWVGDDGLPPKLVDHVIRPLGDLNTEAASRPSIATGIPRGNHSGYTALALAWALGANPIYLVGFDCEPGTWVSMSGKPPIQHVLDRWQANTLRLAAAIADDGRRVKWINSGAAAQESTIYG